MNFQPQPEHQLFPNFLPPEEADELFKQLIEGIPWDERMVSRKTACFGETYDDSGVRYQFQPLPKLLQPWLQRCEQPLGFTVTNCLINYYPDGGSTMGFHSDAIYNLAEGTGIAILSLGSERALTFRSKADPSKLWHCSLPHGSLFLMSQETQQFWTHALKKAQGSGPRISLTLRHILPPEQMNCPADASASYHR
ncbi:MAG: hypothetical protein RL095_4203 [Verrucomicrobiota bacterium]|jgi:alkylated DNA repair dioxygenase AlkB